RLACTEPKRTACAETPAPSGHVSAYVRSQLFEATRTATPPAVPPWRTAMSKVLAWGAGGRHRPPTSSLRASRAIQARPDAGRPPPKDQGLPGPEVGRSRWAASVSPISAKVVLRPIG